MRERFAEDAEKSNKKILAWESLRDGLYKMGSTNKITTINVIDSLLKNDTSFGSMEISELHFIKGDIYYSIDSLQKAIDEFTSSGQVVEMRSPKHLAARAGAYIKLKQFDNAIEDLKIAAEINYDYFWNMGNYYEIIGKKDSAIYYYNRLYSENISVYKYCNDRILELKSPKTKLLTELIFHDRERMVILMKGV